MKIDQLKSSGLEKNYKVVVEAGEFLASVDNKINEIAKNAKISGFRKGKAPANLLKQKYAPQARAEALESLIQKTADKLVTENSLRPIATPDVKIVAFEEGKDVEFEVRFENAPEISVKDFSAIKLDRLVAEVPEEEVKKALEYLAQAKKETTKLQEDRAATKGDTLVIDFTGSVDGVEFAGGKGTDYPLELGSNTFIPGFEDQLVGAKPGDKVDVKVPFPADYHAKDLAGKDALFVCNVKEIRVAKPVEFNDEFAKSLGVDSIDALKDQIKNKIKVDYDAASRMKVKRALLDELDKDYAFEVPNSLVNAEYNMIVKQYEQAKKAGQLDPEDKAKDEKDLLKEYKDISVRRVKLALLLSEIGKTAQISVLPEDVNAAIAQEARKYPGQEKVVFDFYLKNKQAVESLKAPIFEEKIVDHILSKASVTEKTVTVAELFDFSEPKDKKSKKA